MHDFTLNIDGEAVLSVSHLGRKPVLAVHTDAGPVIIGTLLDERCVAQLRAALAKLGEEEEANASLREAVMHCRLKATASQATDAATRPVSA